MLLRSSSARFASQERFGCVLDSILGLSGLQNRCSRVGESIDFIKSAFPQSIFNLILKSPLKMPSKTPQNRSRHLQSTSRGLPDALRDAFGSSLGISSGALGCSWAVLERSGLFWGCRRPHFASKFTQNHIRKNEGWSKNAEDVRKSRFGNASGALLRPVSLHKSVSEAISGLF